MDEHQLTVERDDARRRHLDVLAELDPAVDLDGAVQVLLDGGGTATGPEPGAAVPPDSG